MKRGAWSLLLLAVACAGQHIAQPGWRTEEERPAAPPEELVPAGEPVARYNDGAPGVPSSPVLDALAQMVREAAVGAGRPPPEPDGRLYAVAAELAAALGDGAPPYDAVDFMLSHHGIIEPSPHMTVVKIRGEDLGPAAADLRDAATVSFAGAAFARLGIGVAPVGDGSIHKIVVLLQESAVETEPIPRELPRGGSFELRGRVIPPYGSPSVYVTAQHGTVSALPVRRLEGGRFRATVACGAQSGKLKVEIEGLHAASGPSVLANFAVWCGVAAPRAVAVGAPEPPPADAVSAERQIFELANGERAAAGLPPFVWSDHAAAIARAHSEDMREHGFFAHVSPSTGTLEDRARRGGLAAPLLLENLASAASAREAHQGLMNSPGHRGNLLNPKATHLGVGASLGGTSGQPVLVVTQLFFRVLPKLDADAARRAAAAAIIAARAAARLPPTVEDGALSAIAGAYAAGLAAHEPEAKLTATADHALDLHTERFSQVVTTIAVTGDAVDAVREPSLEPQARFFGVGVAQGRHVELGEGALYVVILFARPR